MKKTKKSRQEVEGQLSFDVEALLDSDEETQLEELIAGAEEMIYCANLGCNDWECLRHNRNAPWGEICNFKQFPGGKTCKGRLE
ncbi:MAG: hypothetical protein IJ036_00220 [Lachnospiraceae bacterium]|nr:hypothetical protein [Lachnospiraceae bacterium]